MGSRSAGLYPLLGEGIFTQDGQPWKHSRELLRRQFVRIQYQNLKVFDEHIDDLIDGLSSAADGVVDLQPFLFRFTLGTTTDLIFGEPIGALGDEIRDAFGSNFDYASYVSAIRIRLADLCFLYKPKKFRDACDVVKTYADHFVSQALKCREQEGKEAAASRYPFILDLYSEYKDPKLVRDQLVHVLIAGRDTTACLMSWTLYVLASTCRRAHITQSHALCHRYMLVRHPEVLQRLRKDIAAVLTDENPNLSRANLAKIPYLRYVLNESQCALHIHLCLILGSTSSLPHFPHGYTVANSTCSLQPFACTPSFQSMSA